MRFIIFVFLFHIWPANNRQDGMWGYVNQEDAKALAFITLTNKCNSCHATKKRTDIFTLENMNYLAPDIWKQVFVKKKMPKGRKVKLTEAELMALRNWLDITLREQN